MAMLTLKRGSVKPVSAFTAFKSAARAVPWVSQACIRTLVGRELVVERRKLGVKLIKFGVKLV